MYTKEFTPRRGDRVLLYNRKYRILYYDIENDYVSLKWIGCNGYETTKISLLHFLKPCPLLYFWQR